MPAAYMSSSESEPYEEEVHFANYAQACDQFPTFVLVEYSSGPSCAKWSNQQSRSSPVQTILVCLLHVFLTKSVNRFLSNFSDR